MGKCLECGRYGELENWKRKFQGPGGMGVSVDTSIRAEGICASCQREKDAQAAALAEALRKEHLRKVEEWESRACFNCAESVKRAANACPHCGSPQPDQPDQIAQMEQDRRLAKEWDVQVYDVDAARARRQADATRFGCELDEVDYARKREEQLQTAQSSAFDEGRRLQAQAGFIQNRLDAYWPQFRLVSVVASVVALFVFLVVWALTFSDPNQGFIKWLAGGLMGGVVWLNTGCRGGPHGVRLLPRDKGSNLLEIDRLKQMAAAYNALGEELGTIPITEFRAPTFDHAINRKPTLTEGHTVHAESEASSGMTAARQRLPTRLIVVCSALGGVLLFWGYNFLGNEKTTTPNPTVERAKRRVIAKMINMEPANESDSLADISNILKSENLRASSTLPPQGKSSYGVESLTDGNPATAWVEADPKYGVGDSLAFTWSGGTDCELFIMNGYQKSESHMTENSRIHIFDTVVEDEKVARLFVKDRMGIQKVLLASKLNIADGQAVKLVIAAVYEGTKWKDTSVSELGIMCP